MTKNRRMNLMPPSPTLKKVLTMHSTRARLAVGFLCLASSGCGLVRISTSVNGKPGSFGAGSPPPAPRSQAHAQHRGHVAQVSPPRRYGPAPAPAPAAASAPAAAPAPAAPYVASPAAAPGAGEDARAFTPASSPASRPQQTAPRASDEEPRLAGNDATERADALMTEVLGQGPVGAPGIGALHPLLKRDRAAAESAGKDLSVFGIKLTYPLALPACAADAPSLLNPLGSAVLGPRVTAPCIGSGGILKMRNEEAMQSSRRRLHGADFQETTVLFPKQSCPDWLTTGDGIMQSCYVNVVTRAGHVASVFFVTAGTDRQASILASLEQKYGKPDPKTTDTYCQVLGRETVRLKVHTFSATPGVHVTFDPLGGACPSMHGSGAGLLTVETSAHHEWIRGAVQKNESKKMRL